MHNVALQGARISLIIVSTIAALLATGRAVADPLDSTLFILPHVAAEPGQQISVPFFITTVHNIGGYELLLRTQTGALQAESISFENTRAYGMETLYEEIWNWESDGIRAFVIFQLDTYIPPGQGPVANLHFLVDSSVPKGSLLPLCFRDEYDIGGPSCDMADEQGLSYYPEFNHGSILVEVDPPTYAMYGDINLNEIAYEIDDYNLMLRQLEGGIESYIDEAEQDRVADVDRDGLPWTITDVKVMRDIILGNTNREEREDDLVTHSQNDSIWMQSYTGPPASQIEIPIFFSNEVSGRAVSFKLDYNPEEIGLVSYSLEGSRIPPSWEKVSVVERESGLMFYAMQSSSIEHDTSWLWDGSGLLVTLTFEIRNPAQERIRFHFSRLQNHGQACGYDYPFDFWRMFASLQQIDHDIYLTYVRGDADGSGFIDIDDVVYLISFLFSDGPPPEGETGDFNNDQVVDLNDVTALLSFIFG